MTRLQEEIRATIPDYDTVEFETADQYWDMVATAAAEVAKRYIERAYIAGIGRQHLYQGEKKSKDEWMKENGVL
jgi:hypothetical protein